MRSVILLFLLVFSLQAFGKKQKPLFFMTHISKELVNDCNDPIILSINEILNRVSSSVLIKIRKENHDCIQQNKSQLVIDGAGNIIEGNGNRKVIIKTNEIILSGGFYELCESNTLDDIIKSYFDRFTFRKKDDLNIHIPMNMSFSSRLRYWKDQTRVFTLLDYFKNAYSSNCEEENSCVEFKIKFLEENILTLHTEHHLQENIKFIAFFNGENLYEAGCSENCKTVKMYFWSNEKKYKNKYHEVSDKIILTK